MSSPSTETNETVTTVPPVSRRSLLGTAGAAIVAAVSGCTAEAERQLTPESLVDETARVDPGGHSAFPFSVDTEQLVTVRAYLSDRSIDVREDGPGVDVVIMSPSQYSEFQNDGTFAYLAGVSMPDVVNGQVSDELESGEYVALVDNTAAGAAGPDGSSVTAVVNLEITAAAHRE